MEKFFLELSYLLGCIAFIVGLRMLSSPVSARKGNLIAGVGMGIAILGTMIFHRSEATGEGIHNFGWIIGGIFVGSVIGYLMAIKVKMTAMPQMVAFFNGVGGATSALISSMELFASDSPDTGFLLVAYLGIVIGMITFSGSMIAFGKLDEKIKDIRVSYMTYINLTFLVITLVLMGVAIFAPDVLGIKMAGWLLLGISFLYGILFVMPIGGADMPVVIALLNSFSGIAGAFVGFLYHSNIMLIGGILVGASGIILSVLMCNAMNRSLLNVLIGNFGGGATGAGMTSGDMTIKEVSLNDAAIMCGYSSKVCIVPGYGLAVAQAQHVCHEFEKSLEKQGAEVYYAIHPVAGRMPGHMNVLLAEADVPYSKLVEMDDANDMMPQTDVCIIVGANDVVNPAAENDPGSPIYGMPVIKVWEAKNVIVMKRSMRPGYAGIENPLFFHERTKMLFGDAKDTLSKLVSELKTI